MPILSISTPSPRHITLAQRQTAAIRLSAIFCMLVTAYYVLDNVRWGEYSTAAVDALFSTAFACAAAAAPRYRVVAGHAVLINICAVCILTTLIFGRAAENQNFLLALGPISALLLDPRRPYGVMFYCALSSVSTILIEFTVPPWIDRGAPLLAQLQFPFTSEILLGAQAIDFSIRNVVIEFGIGFGAYFSMHWTALSDAALSREYARSELLLRNLLPASIAVRLKDEPSKVIADSFDSVSILFADVVNFTPTSARKKPEDVIDFLSRLFGEFDALAEKHGLEKIKTIGDCYMVAGGMPEKSEGHAQSMADMALDMIAASQALAADFDDQLSIRIGLHVGPAMAGVIGRNKPYYDVWGDTINVASRMESSGLPGRIQITPEVKDILGAHYDFESRGMVDIKGKGPMDVYFLVGKSGGDKQ